LEKEGKQQMMIYPRNPAARTHLCQILAAITVRGVNLTPVIAAVEEENVPEELRGPRSQYDVVVVIDPFPETVRLAQLSAALVTVVPCELTESDSGVELGAKRVVVTSPAPKGFKLILKFLKRTQIDGVLLPCVKFAADEIPEPLSGVRPEGSPTPSGVV
jgi:hypothetical protein